MFTRILVPVDGTDAAQTAVPVAAELARRFQSELFLLEIIPTAGATLGVATDIASGAATDPAVFGTDVAIRTTIAEGYVEALAQQLATEGLSVRWSVGTGSESAGIVEAARAEGVDLIVMATHARGGIGRLLHGSTTDAVLRTGHIPVLAIPPAAEGD